MNVSLKGTVKFALSCSGIYDVIINIAALPLIVQNND